MSLGRLPWLHSIGNAKWKLPGNNGLETYRSARSPTLLAADDAEVGSSLLKRNFS